jgi:hypothetical protein
VLSFGTCDNSITKENSKDLYFQNNSRLLVTSSEHLTGSKNLHVCKVIREDKIPFKSEYHKAPTVITGDYEEYKQLLNKKFNDLKKFQKSMVKKYRLKNTKNLKAYMNGEEKTKFKRYWSSYLNFKGTPYARHHQFITTYKAQGKSFKHVIIVWGELPDADHKYVALSRAVDKIDIMTKV